MKTLELSLEERKAFLVVWMVKSLPAVWETQVRSLGQEDPLQKAMVTHSSTLAWKIPWTEEPGRLQSMGSQRTDRGRKERTQLSNFTFFTFLSLEGGQKARIPWRLDSGMGLRQASE